MFARAWRSKWLLTAFALASLAFIIALFIHNRPTMNENRLKNFIISWVGSPISWDPLDFDNANNLFSARMLYATPLEASRDGALSSRILSRFAVSGDQLTVSFSIRAGAAYADGTPIKADDVAFAIARMAHARPHFPVLESIQGLTEWLKDPSPLKTYPTGIAVSGDDVTIQFTRPEINPLYRFTLEIFAVIPRSCIDLKTNKLSCDRPPESGPYVLTSGGLKSSELVFSRRDSDVTLGPEKIRFQFIEPMETENVLSRDEGDTVVFASDLNYTDEALTNLKAKFASLPTAKSWHGRFLINVKFPLFETRECRATFAEQFRKSYSDLKLKNHRLETSIFTELMPGYIPPEKLKSSAPLSPDQLVNCKRLFQGQTVRWMRRGTRMDDFAQALDLTATALGMGLDEVAAGSMTVQEAMASSEVGLVAGSTGFWPVDPFGDLQMLFTPNMHKHLAAVANNPDLQVAIRASRKASPPPAEQLAKINQILYDEAIYNVFTHHQYMYLGSRTNESTLRRAPLGVTVPYPWQVFDEPMAN